MPVIQEGILRNLPHGPSDPTASGPLQRVGDATLHELGEQGIPLDVVGLRAERGNGETHLGPVPSKTLTP